jgi:hypothetical protein
MRNICDKCGLGSSDPLPYCANCGDLCCHYCVYEMHGEDDYGRFYVTCWNCHDEENVYDQEPESVELTDEPTTDVDFG